MSSLFSEWTHQALCDDLQSHLQGNTERMVFQNITMGQYHGGRPDVFTVMKSFANFRADTYEIKVSRSDFLSDVTSGKWRKYLDHSHAVWFAVPAGMVKPAELPEGVGLIVRSENSWRSQRKPKPKVMDTLPRDAWLRLVMDLHPIGYHGEYKNPRPEANAYNAANIARKKMGEDLARLIVKPEQYRAEVESARAHADAEIARHRERQAEGLKSTSEQQQRLNAILGLPPTSSHYEAAHAIQTLRNMVSLENMEWAYESMGKAIKDFKKLMGERSEPKPERDPLHSD